MKKVLFIGSRLNALDHIKDFPELKLTAVYVEEDSLLHRNLDKIDSAAAVKVFTAGQKAEIIDDIAEQDFDILVSNGCPIILPISKLQTGKRVFVNIHPTVLPGLRGKTPLNGIFLTHFPHIGATMHYIDDSIDTGNIIHQEKLPVTDDLDQGLVYKISFDMETVAFKEGMAKLIEHDFDYPGRVQAEGGSYFNRTPELQTVDLKRDDTDAIIDKVKSFGIGSQGTFITTKHKQFRVLTAEKIINQYLLELYAELDPGEVAFEYDGLLLLKTKDGLIKLIRYDETEA